MDLTKIQTTVTFGREKSTSLFERRRMAYEGQEIGSDRIGVPYVPEGTRRRSPVSATRRWPLG